MLQIRSNSECHFVHSVEEQIVTVPERSQLERLTDSEIGEQLSELEYGIQWTK